MDILTIGEILIDLTQTGRDEKGIPQFAAPAAPPPTWPSRRRSWAHRPPSSARWATTPSAAI